MLEKNINNQGFTLVEIAMVVIIFSLLMNLFGYGLLAYQEKQKYTTTYERMATIEKAIDEFLELNARLPCVARLDRRPDQAGFGFETFSLGPGGERTCRFGIPGTVVFQQTAAGGGAVGGTPPHWNRFGSVPVRTLNLPDEYLVDAWGSRFSYIVSERQASESAPGVSMYRENSGAIRVIDTNGNSVIDQVNQEYGGFANFAEYALISHGEDLKGGRSLANGNVALVPCPGIAAEIQAENCTHTTANPAIVVSDIISEGGNAQEYDDIVIFKAGTNRNEILPSGAIIGFDQEVANGNPPASNMAVPAGGFQCPPGWVAAEDARGRFIVGATAPGVGVSRVRRSNTAVATPTTRNYIRLGRKDGDGGADNTSLANAEVSTPPYVTTLYCEKQ